jgi:hypothetical protein
VLLTTFVAAYTLVHLLSWALVRYRLPIDGVLVIFAGLAVARLFEGVRKLGPTPTGVSRQSSSASPM